MFHHASQLCALDGPIWAVTQSCISWTGLSGARQALENISRSVGKWVHRDRFL